MVKTFLNTKGTKCHEGLFLLSSLSPFVSFVFSFFSKYTANRRGAEGFHQLPSARCQLMINFVHLSLMNAHCQ
jgi:hypothetical protein